MISRNRTKLIPLRDAAADIGLCILGFRLKIKCLRTSRGMQGSTVF